MKSWKNSECCNRERLIPMLTFYANLVKASKYATIIVAYIAGLYQVGL